MGTVLGVLMIVGEAWGRLPGWLRGEIWLDKPYIENERSSMIRSPRANKPRTAPRVGLVFCDTAGALSTVGCASVRTGTRGTVASAARLGIAAIVGASAKADIAAGEEADATAEGWLCASAGCTAATRTVISLISLISAS